MNQKRNFKWIAFLCAFLLTGFSVFAQDSTLIDMDSVYYAQKQGVSPSGRFPAGKSGVNLNGSGITNDHNSSGYNPPNTANRLPSESCIIPTDATWSFLPGNDDGSTGVINLGFTFNFYGTSYTQCYINNNGNITFGAPFGGYTPSGFPSAQQMIAGFWDDVDTRTCGRVRYKLFGTRLVVSYEGVGQYSQNCTGLNTFQIIIGTTNDPVIGLGQNVKFYYGDMQWTKGASTVGINKGDNVNYIQVGRFGILNSTVYDGGGGNTDGLDYLDYQCFAFNVSNAGNIPPSFSGLPANNTVTVNCGQTSTFTIQALPPEVNQTVSTTVNTGGLCNTSFTTTNGTVSTTNLTITGNACNQGTHTITFTATDNGSPVQSTTATLTVNVINCCVAPTISCPSNITVNNNAGQCGANVTYPAATATGTTPTITYSQASGSLFPVGTTTVTATATNSCGVVTCTFTVTVFDNQLPVINCPSNISVNATSAAGAAVTYTTPVGIDNCPGAFTIRIAGLASGSTFPIGTTTVTHFVVDASSNTAQCSFTVTVVGVAPVIVCPGNITVNNTTGQCGANVTFVATETTAIPASVITYSHQPGTFFPVGTTVVTATATNTVGVSTCTFNIVVVDNQAPAITCAANQTQTADEDQCGAQVTVVSPATGDNCGVASVINNRNNTADASGVYPVGPTTVIWTVTDIHGNSSTCTQTITVTDDEAPAITCAANQTQTADEGQCGAQVTVVSPATGDNCGVASVINNRNNTNNASGVYPVGTTTIIWTVTDIHGNASTCIQTITVTDNQAPVITCNAAISVNNDLGICGALVNYTVTSSDNCPGQTVAQTAGLPSGSVFPVGVTTNTFVVIDAHSNTATCSFTVTVTDNERPTIVCPSNKTVNCQDDKTPAANGTATATDNCTAAANIVISYTDASTQNASPSNAGYYNYVITRTWKATDVAGKFSTCVQTITVRDVTAPVITCPASVTVNCQDNNTSSSTGVATGTDNCSPVAISQTQTSTQDANVNVAAHYNYVITRTWKATDVTGNASTCVQTITVRDITAPTAICKPVTITLLGGTATITAADVNNGSSDICSPVTLSVSKTSFNCSDIGVNTVILTVKDASNNSSTCTALVTVVGERPTCSIASIPTSTVYTGGVSTNIYLGYGPQTTNLLVSAPASGATYTYKWIGYTTGLSSITSGNPLYTPTATGSFTFTVEVTNKYGCKSTCSITICVLDIREYSNGTPNSKVYLCHNSNTLSISTNAVSAHLSNHAGDKLGKCNDVICGTTSAQFVQTEEVKDIPVVTPAATVPAEQKFEVKLYPNPTPGDFNIQVITGSSEQIMVRIMNGNGTVVQASIKLTKQGLIALGSKLPGGTYFVEVTQGKNRSVTKLVKLN